MSELPYLFTEELKEKLTALGWYPERRVDITKDLEAVQQSGWEIFPMAQTFVEQFDGLGNHSDDYLGFAGSGTNWEYNDPDYIEKFLAFEKSHDSRIFPIGEWNGWVLITIDEKGRILKGESIPTRTLATDAQSDFEKLIEDIYRVHVHQQQRKLNDS